MCLKYLVCCVGVGCWFDLMEMRLRCLFVRLRGGREILGGGGERSGRLGDSVNISVEGPLG